MVKRCRPLYSVFHSHSWGICKVCTVLWPTYRGHRRVTGSKFPNPSQNLYCNPSYSVSWPARKLSARANAEDSRAIIISGTSETACHQPQQRPGSGKWFFTVPQLQVSHPTTANRYLCMRRGWFVLVRLIASLGGWSGLIRTFGNSSRHGNFHDAMLLLWPSHWAVWTLLGSTEANVRDEHASLSAPVVFLSVVDVHWDGSRFLEVVVANFRARLSGWTATNADYESRPSDLQSDAIRWVLARWSKIMWLGNLVGLF